jgi:maltooligosyltrehalose trehalohydrolase
VPDPQDPATREASVLRWDERRDGDHARMLAWYHDLIALRRKEKVLTDGRLRAVSADVDEDAAWLVVHRGDLRVVANLADQPQAVPVDAEPIDVVLAWDPAATSLQDAAVDLGAHGVAVVRVSG